ncbi:ribonuclease HIII [Schinkia azotoformans]|uniref:ribonuclease HIII n=1 Tax=Schinkia azotoformans TaxID=1454 RepID=UPI002DBE579E|nr:ribonuclease HIII [Schinkia azotoformans]MEC1714971.1 ribonuclease HIII [Schinkia azotoformans]MEC1747114.1 ribonuclease HIII [Schinkia azotoformans]MED4376237.1 ribonuclease HIII [Schinkia azotoformans]
MSNTVLTVTKDTIYKMKEHYKNAITKQNPPGSVFVAKPNGCTITAYNSGKVLFQGNGASIEAAKWGANKPSQSSTSKSSSTKKKNIAANSGRYAPPPNIGQLSIIGSDEVGTGDYFGPITVTAAYVSNDKIELLKELGVKDSKDLNDTQIAKIAEQIIPIVPHSLLILRNAKYNELEQSGMNQGKLKAMLHNQAISKVLTRVKSENNVDGILIDQFCQPDVFFHYLLGKSIPWKPSENVYFSTKAEGIHIAVAAASIIARYAFVKEFEKLSKMAGFELPKGAGPKVDQKAAEFIKKYGEASLTKVAKLHFANTDKAKRLIK